MRKDERQNRQKDECREVASNHSSGVYFRLTCHVLSSVTVSCWLVLIPSCAYPGNTYCRPGPHIWGILLIRSRGYRRIKSACLSVSHTRGVSVAAHALAPAGLLLASWLPSWLTLAPLHFCTAFPAPLHQKTDTDRPQAGKGQRLH
ncbi:hypothetical protein DL98DRAFT_3405 [Cadophora sp. DSE1049]|nr:hypothetical protein DL98DRAFT_3405 [Cadophora sp. DSE1049]